MDVPLGRAEAPQAWLPPTVVNMALDNPLIVQKLLGSRMAASRNTVAPLTLCMAVKKLTPSSMIILIRSCTETIRRGLRSAPGPAR